MMVDVICVGGLFFEKTRNMNYWWSLISKLITWQDGGYWNHYHGQKMWDGYERFHIHPAKNKNSANTMSFSMGYLWDFYVWNATLFQLLQRPFWQNITPKALCVSIFLVGVGVNQQIFILLIMITLTGIVCRTDFGVLEKNTKAFVYLESELRNFPF